MTICYKTRPFNAAFFYIAVLIFVNNDLYLPWSDHALHCLFRKITKGNTSIIIE